jgi:hypothetical protein
MTNKVWHFFNQCLCSYLGPITFTGSGRLVVWWRHQWKIRESPTCLSGCLGIPYPVTPTKIHVSRVKCPLLLLNLNQNWMLSTYYITAEYCNSLSIFVRVMGIKIVYTFLWYSVHRLYIHIYVYTTSFHMIGRLQTIKNEDPTRQRCRYTKYTMGIMRWRLQAS